MVLSRAAEAITDPQLRQMLQAAVIFWVVFSTRTIVTLLWPDGYDEVELAQPDSVVAREGAPTTSLRRRRRVRA